MTYIPGGPSVRPAVSTAVPSGRIHFGQRVFNKWGPHEASFMGRKCKKREITMYNLIKKGVSEGVQPHRN